MFNRSLKMVNSLLRVVSGILLALFVKMCSHNFMIFEVKLKWWFWSRQNRKWGENTVFCSGLFCSHSAFWHWFFKLFFRFFNWLLSKLFSDPYIVNSLTRSFFCLVNENSLDWVRACPATFLQSKLFRIVLVCFFFKLCSPWELTSLRTQISVVTLVRLK